MVDAGLRRPDFSGAAGHAWAVDLPAAIARAGLQGKPNATVAVWILEVPGAHPVWRLYELVLIHLRLVPTWPPPKLYLEGATHELILHALAPDQALRWAVETADVRRLLPANFAAQFVAPSDTAAMRRAEHAVQRVVAGDLSPDSDFRRDWVALFGDNMLAEALPAGAPSCTR